ncbi:restriction endonuclease subunit S [Sinorhizobium medicae]|nr:restriction endonuclease subunit S [Sinorhizobium medicae]
MERRHSVGFSEGHEVLGDYGRGRQNYAIRNQGSATNLIPTNSILLVNRSGILKHTLPVGITRRPVAINQDIKALVCGSHAHPEYIAHLVKSAEPVVLTWVRATTADNFPIGNLRELEIPLPPLDEQQRIAAILDKADQLRQKRRQAIALLDSLTQSIFLEMFGDPATNPNNFPLMKVGELAERYSDGPFGSNLKSEHYVDQGIRIIRLQNIGVGEFIDDDRAYITEEHFNSIAKHECLPGDVLIGTLGDPNLRACVQPRWLTRALNKADCVQLRPDANIALSEYCSCLLNQESTMRLAQGLVLGQTRGRISMGRLRDLELPIAPLPLQARFVSIVRVHEEQKQFLRESAHQLDALFSSLQHRAFSGQL